MKFSRRDALKLGGLAAVGGAGLVLPFGNGVNAGSASQLKNLPKPYTASFSRQQVLPSIGTRLDAEGRTVQIYDIAAKPGAASIVPGVQTPLLGYEGMIPARRIDVEQGTPIELRMHNRLAATHPTFGTPMNLSTHLHGSGSLPQYDGYASDLTLPGQVKTYQFPNFQVARTLWYHDHGVHYTAQNVYSGLASQYHMHDPMERALLPQGEFDVALTLGDIMFQANGAELYDDRTRSGLWGDVILVNGKPWPVMKVKRRIYRFRVLNSSPSRSYRPTLSPATPVYVVATDGGLVPKAKQIAYWRHGSAERYEILIDFSKFAVGQRIEMKNLSNPNNRDFANTDKIMAFDVIGDSFDLNDPTALTLPGDLNPGNETMNLVETPGMKVRNIQLEHNDVTNTWSLNGKTWQDVVDSGYKSVLANPGLGDTEVWELENKSGGWFHPLHIHLIDFKVLSRNGKPPFDWELGPKDVVYTGEAEKVRVIMKFGPHRGKYMVHCHNLVHEDHDMMGQFSVGLAPTDVDMNDPIWADPAAWDPTP